MKELEGKKVLKVIDKSIGIIKHLKTDRQLKIIFDDSTGSFSRLFELRILVVIIDHISGKILKKFILDKYNKEKTVILPEGLIDVKYFNFYGNKGDKIEKTDEISGLHPFDEENRCVFRLWESELRKEDTYYSSSKSYDYCEKKEVFCVPQTKFSHNFAKSLDLIIFYFINLNIKNKIFHIFRNTVFGSLIFFILFSAFFLFLEKNIFFLFSLLCCFLLIVPTLFLYDPNNPNSG